MTKRVFKHLIFGTIVIIMVNDRKNYNAFIISCDTVQSERKLTTKLSKIKYISKIFSSFV